MLNVTEIEVSRLKPWEGNPRLNDCAVDAVARSISSFGFNVPIVCDRELVIVAGHTRWKAARKLGMEKVPVVVLDLNETQRRAFAIADNKTGEIAEWDFPALREVLESLKTEDVELESLGFSEEELRRILGDEEEDVLVRDEIENRTEPGDTWILGEHRLLCGSATERGCCEHVLAGHKARLVFGGPPCFNQKGLGNWIEYEDYLADIQQIVRNCVSAMDDGAIIAWNIGNSSSDNHDHAGHHSGLLEKSDVRYLDTIAWVKCGGNFGVPRNCHIKHRGYYYPAFQWESILVFQKRGAMPRMTREGIEYMSEHQTNVWQVAAVTNQMEKYGHPGVCPVEIPYRLMQAYSVRDDSVIDPFMGSGTTLIAAEKCGRRAFGIEVCTRFCDFAVRRWENLTGRRAVKERRVGT